MGERVVIDRAGVVVFVVLTSREAVMYLAVTVGFQGEHWQAWWNEEGTAAMTSLSPRSEYIREGQQKDLVARMQSMT